MYILENSPPTSIRCRRAQVFPVFLDYDTAKSRWWYKTSTIVLMSMNLEVCDFSLWQLPILLKLFWHFLLVLINKDTTTWLASQHPSYTHCRTHHYQLSQALSFINNLGQELTSQYTLEMTQDLIQHQLLCMFLDGPSVFLSSHCVCTIVHF